MGHGINAGGQSADDSDPVAGQLLRDLFGGLPAVHGRMPGAHHSYSTLVLADERPSNVDQYGAIVYLPESWREERIVGAQRLDVESLQFPQLVIEGNAGASSGK